VRDDVLLVGPQDHALRALVGDGGFREALDAQALRLLELREAETALQIASRKRVCPKRVCLRATSRSLRKARLSHTKVRDPATNPAAAICRESCGCRHSG